MPIKFITPRLVRSQENGRRLREAKPLQLDLKPACCGSNSPQANRE